MADALSPFTQLYRINALRAVSLVACCSLAVAAPPHNPPAVTYGLEIVGTIAVFMAITGRAWSLFYIGGRKNDELVMRGPYSATRNPLYFFSLVGIAGICLQTGSVLMAALITGFAYLAFDMAMRGEEAYLANRFGDGFKHYRRATPRLLPRPSLWRETDGTILNSSASIRSLKDGTLFILAWLAAGLVRPAQAADLLPVLWTLPL